MRETPVKTAVRKRSFGASGIVVDRCHRSATSHAAIGPFHIAPIPGQRRSSKAPCGRYAEIDRRAQQMSKSDASSAVLPSAATRNKVSTVEQLPDGNVNLIRAPFSARLNPAALVRAFHVAPSRVIRDARCPEE